MLSLEVIVGIWSVAISIVPSVEVTLVFGGMKACSAAGLVC